MAQRRWRVVAEFDYDEAMSIEEALQKALEEIEPGKEIDWVIEPVVKDLR